MRDDRTVRGLPLAGMAVVGAVVGHWLGYVLAFPDAHLRTEVLTQSGHGYWMLSVKAAAILGFAALGTVLLRHLSRAGRGDRPAENWPAALALRLAVVQVAAFVAVEAVERAFAGEPVTQMFQHHLLLLGIAIQIAVACGGALVLHWFGRAAATLSRWIAPLRLDRPHARTVFPALVFAPPPQVLHCGAGLRGPPSR
jgi:hypothetical protein